MLINCYLHPCLLPRGGPAGQGGRGWRSLCCKEQNPASTLCSLVPLSTWTETQNMKISEAMRSAGLSTKQICEDSIKMMLRAPGARQAPTAHVLLQAAGVVGSVLGRVPCPKCHPSPLLLLPMSPHKGTLLPCACLP